MNKLLVLWLCCLCNFIQCARILVLPIQGGSHLIMTNALGQEMKKNGHEVYTVAEDHHEGKQDQIGAAGLEILYYYVPKDTTYTANSEELQKKFVEGIMKGDTGWGMLGQLTTQSCNNMMADEKFLKKVESLQFDLAIVQPMPVLPCAYLLPHIFNIPHVSFYPSYFPNVMPGHVGLPSYIPPFYSAPKSITMTFKERFLSTLFHIAMKKEIFPTLAWLTGFTSEVNDLSLIEKFRGKGMVSDDIRGWLDFFDETQLVVMANSGLMLNDPKPFFPNVVSVEGLSLKKAKPLPKEIEDLVQSSEHGIIVVSFGSGVKYLPDDVIIKMVNVFGKRKELFLMRYAGALNKDNFDQPSNVKFLSWLPQNDLLAHNKTKLFITHGGFNGLTEAVNNGVPMLCVPLFAEQPANALKLEAKGFGLSIQLTDYTEEELLKKMDELISNPSYRKNTERAGQIMRHRPMSGTQTAAFWIEHVLRFGGEHLRPSTMHLTWWQFYCLDTLGVIVLVIVFVLFVFYILIKFLVKAVFGLFRSSKHVKNE